MTNPVRQLFGTDGIRGIAGEFPLTPESTFLIGCALGHDLTTTRSCTRAEIDNAVRQWADRIAGVKPNTIDARSGVNRWRTQSDTRR